MSAQELAELDPMTLRSMVTPLFLIDSRFQHEALDELVRRAYALAALSSGDATRPTSTSGPGCKNHRGDPHNLCEACWALEPAGCLPVTQEEGE